MKTVWVVKLFRINRFNHTNETTNSHVSSVDSVWTSKEHAINYLNDITDNYDEIRGLWYSEYNKGDYHQINMYEIFQTELRA